MLTIINPATEAVIAELPSDNLESIAQKYRRARAAQREWAARPYEARAAILRAFGEGVKRDQMALGEVLSSEMGKPVGQAQYEVGATLDRLAFFLENTPAVLAPEVLVDEGATLEQLSREPLGVIANISAWNYPYFVGANVFIPGLLTGNAVLYKPSEFATLTGQRIAALLHEAGVPEDVFALIIGGGAEGAALLEQPVDGIFFTGSYETGKKIAQAAAATLTKVQLELGGKDPLYVCDDVDPRRAAAAAAEGAFYNTGQSCCAVERIYVHAAIAEPFIEALVEEVKGYQVGDPTAEGAFIGPLTRDPQRDVLDAQVADAVEKGATLRCGGARVEGLGYYYAPTVLTDVNHDMLVMSDESFGPIIGVQIVEGDEEATALMADTTYGLTASVFTMEEARARSVLSALSVGTAYWNCCDRVSPRLPWSGCNHSGLGLTLSREGISTFTRPKGWHLRPW